MAVLAFVLHRPGADVSEGSGVQASPVRAGYILTLWTGCFIIILQGMREKNLKEMSSKNEFRS
jgi:hypothetical protein